MSDTLTEICTKKYAHIAAQKSAVSESALYGRALHSTPPRGFQRALKAKLATGGIGLIAEV
jgi:indole-3-glycerol phosphate synthase